MAKRSAPPTPRSASLSPAEMEAAIPKLERRISELQAIDVSSVQRRGEPRLEAVEKKVDDTLVEVFGPDTVEYRRYSIELDTASINLGGTPISEVREGYRRGIEQAVMQLEAIVELFRERLKDLGAAPVSRAITALSNIDLHPEISRAVLDLYANGHYANAVEDACKVLDGLVKIRSGKFELSGTELMQNVFSPNRPVLKFSKLQTESEKSEQQGMMFLYAGSMLALRNPRAHGIIEDRPETALDSIVFISFLAKAIDKAERA